MAADPLNELNTPPRAGLIPNPKSSEREQILGTGARPDEGGAHIDHKWRPFYDKLVKQRDQFIDATTDLGSKAREVNPDALQDEPAEIGSMTYERDRLLGAATMDDELLAEVNEAISRIESGTYGTCQATGRPIPLERLEAIPWTRFTAEAQQEMEARGEVTKGGIGPLGGIRERGTASPGPWREKEGSL